MPNIAESELVLNHDGSVYHLKLHPGEIADDIIVVGDPGRVDAISMHFDRIEVQRQNREIRTHTGYIGSKRITVLSTGMGTDNIDIVLNELDALVNIDLKDREIKSSHVALNIIRLGTSGALQPDIPVDSTVISSHGLGLDGMLYYYRDLKTVYDPDITEAFISQSHWDAGFPRPYAVAASDKLFSLFKKDHLQGITATAPGFYGPQGRVLRLEPRHPDLNQLLTDFRFGDQRIVNFEMETSALYGLGKLLGHDTLTICAIIANRVSKTYSSDAQATVKKLIVSVLEKLTA